jgi:hypothetical protein
MSSVWSWSGEIGTTALEPAVRAKPRHPQRNVGAEPQRFPNGGAASSGDTERQIASHHGVD